MGWVTSENYYKCIDEIENKYKIEGHSLGVNGKLILIKDGDKYGIKHIYCKEKDDIVYIEEREIYNNPDIKYIPIIWLNLLEQEDIDKFSKEELKLYNYDPINRRIDIDIVELLNSKKISISDIMNSVGLGDTNKILEHIEKVKGLDCIIDYIKQYNDIRVFDDNDEYFEDFIMENSDLLDFNCDASVADFIMIAFNNTQRYLMKYVFRRLINDGDLDFMLDELEDYINERKK